MTEVLDELRNTANELLRGNLDHHTEQSARILYTALIALIEGRMIGVEIYCIDQDGTSWVFAHRGVPGVDAVLQPIARVQ